MKQRLTGLLNILIILSIVLVGCDTAVGCNAPAEENTPKKTELELGYISKWSDENANSHMVKAVLEEKFGVTINLKDMDAGFLWQSLGSGDIDFMVNAWLPYSHDMYLKRVADRVVVLDPLYEQARVGLVVPSYVEIDSIEELNANADKFDDRIIGVGLGAGIMYQTIIAKSEYDLKDMDLVVSSEQDMTAKLITDYEDGKWIVVTGWIPHWKFDEMNLKFLEDPKNIYGEEESIHAVTRLGFAKDHPEINTFLESYALDEDQFISLINIMEEYDDDNEAAKVWIEDNRELVDSWFE